MRKRKRILQTISTIVEEDEESLTPVEEEKESSTPAEKEQSTPVGKEEESSTSKSDNVIDVVVNMIMSANLLKEVEAELRNIAIERKLEECATLVTSGSNNEDEVDTFKKMFSSVNLLEKAEAGLKNIPTKGKKQRVTQSMQVVIGALKKMVLIPGILREAEAELQSIHTKESEQQYPNIPGEAELSSISPQDDEHAVPTTSKSNKNEVDALNKMFSALTLLEEVKAEFVNLGSHDVSSVGNDLSRTSSNLYRNGFSRGGGHGY